MGGEGIENQVITTNHEGGNWFHPEKVIIFRLSSVFGSTLNRYSCYLQFAFLGLSKLLRFKPTHILYYETYSALPVFLYSILFPSVNLLIHYHEFESLTEKQSSTAYSKFLHLLEKRLLRKAIWVSLTNEERLQQFHELHPQLLKDQLNIFPNYPSKFWINQRLTKDTKTPAVLKFIYVGSLGLETTYIREMIDWIQAKNGRATLTIVSQNAKKEVLDYLSEKPWVKFIENIPYQELPNIICENHTGVVLYNGHSPNYIYNLPNKVNEYLACGLNVWYSDVLISTRKFAEENPSYPLFSVDFSMGKDLLAPNFSSEPFEFKHWHEEAVQPLIDSIKHAMDSSLNTF